MPRPSSAWTGKLQARYYDFNVWSVVGWWQDWVWGSFVTAPPGKQVRWKLNPSGRRVSGSRLVSSSPYVCVQPRKIHAQAKLGRGTLESRNGFDRPGHPPFFLSGYFAQRSQSLWSFNVNFLSDAYASGRGYGSCRRPRFGTWGRSSSWECSRAESNPTRVTLAGIEGFHKICLEVCRARWENFGTFRCSPIRVHFCGITKRMYG